MFRLVEQTSFVEIPHLGVAHVGQEDEDALKSGDHCSHAPVGGERVGVRAASTKLLF